MAPGAVRDPERLGKLVDAVLSIGSDLSLPAVLRRIVDAGVGLVGAGFGALGVLDDSGRGLAEFVYTGVTRDRAAAIGQLPEGHGILGLLVLDARPLRLADLTRHPDSVGFPPSHPPMRSFLGVPIRIRDQVYGNLYLTEKQGGDEFSADDEALAVALAGAAAIAIDNARLHARVRGLALADERERIAANLHDTVIQRLFATGLALESSLRLMPPEAAARVERSVADLDEIVRQIRSTIFALEAPRARHRGVSDELFALATEATASLGFTPQVMTDGAFDAVPDDVVSHVLAILREALSNVARHAQATRVDIHVAVTPERDLTVSVSDDGSGFTADDQPDGRGVRAMTDRASAVGGDCSIGNGPDGHGAVVTWRVPLAAG